MQFTADKATMRSYIELDELEECEGITTEDGKEGPHAFVEKRKPNFQGR